MAQLLMPFSNEKPQIIRKSNELIEARYKLSVAEQRLVILLASEISPSDEDFKSYEIRVADFAKMFELQTDKSIYEKVEQAAEGLLSQKIVLQDTETKEVTNWLSYVKYVKGSGVVILEFHKSLKPYLLQLKGHYTQYKLHHVMNFKSQYSMRLYELLKMDAFKANKNGQFEKYFELQEYRDLLGVDKKAYSIFADFRKYVVQPLVSEISDKTDLIIADVKYGKTGRKITNITFSVGVRSEQETKLRQANLRIEDIKPEKESDNHPVIDSLVNLGFALEIAKRYKNKYGVKQLERNIAYTLAKKQEGKVKDTPSYLNMAIENDYGGAWDIEKKKAEEKKKLALEAEKAKKAEEERKEKETKEKYKKLLDSFHSFPSGMQDMVKNNFIADIQENNNFVFTEWKKAEKAGKNPLDLPMVRGQFIKFLLEQRICE